LFSHDLYIPILTGSIQVLEVYSNLMRVFVKSHGADGNKQFKERIAGILQKRIFKEKEYPRGNDIEFSKLESLVAKALKLAARSRFKIVVSMAQNATFWILKIISSKNCSEEELTSVVDKFRSMLTDYFNNKKSRLKLGFVKEVVRRNPWIGRELFGFVLQEIGSAQAEYRRTQTLELLDCILKSWVGDVAGADALVGYLAQLCGLVQEVLSNIPENKLRRKEVRKFCTGVLQTVSRLHMKEQFQNTLNLEARSLCQAHLGAAFASFEG
jgi:DNA polymerase phi